jgi:hypothetical protein
VLAALALDPAIDDVVVAPALLASALAAADALLAPSDGNVNRAEVGELGPCAWDASYATTITRAVEPTSPNSVALACVTSASCL